MSVYNFYPGPSRVYPKVPGYMQDAFEEEVVSINHRSEHFMSIAKRCIDLLKNKLNIPNGYHIYFVSSATECWEIIAQSLVKNSSAHIFSGSFGEKWYQYSAMLHPSSQMYQFDPEHKLDANELPDFVDSEVICLTQNETSNATQISPEFIRDVHTKYKDKLIAIDATSSMGGIRLPFDEADIWYASVQKCFGLPAGLGILVCSPKAIKRAIDINDTNHYNSLIRLRENMDKFQTSYTPNVLAIYLLSRVMEDVPHIDQIDKQTKKRYSGWEEFFKSEKNYGFLIQNPGVRSNTLLALKGDATYIRQLQMKAKEAGITLGKGYGPWKEDCFRIANFPALLEEEINYLKDFLTTYSN